MKRHRPNTSLLLQRSSVMLCQKGAFVCEQNNVARHDAFRSSGTVGGRTGTLLARNWRTAAWEVVQQWYLQLNCDQCYETLPTSLSLEYSSCSVYVPAVFLHCSSQNLFFCCTSNSSHSVMHCLSGNILSAVPFSLIASCFRIIYE